MPTQNKSLLTIIGVNNTHLCQNRRGVGGKLKTI